MIERQDRQRATVLRMHRGKANALDLELLDGLATELATLRNEKRAVVLTGSGGMFSAGVDLRRLLAEGLGYAARMLAGLSELLGRLIDHPLPVVAAVNGHAIAGGLVLAAACDLRLLAAGPAKLGLTELAVGVPFPPLALEVVRSAFGTQRARELAYGGRLYSDAEAHALGLVDELVEADRLLERALAMAGRLAGSGAPAFELSKRQLAATVRGRVEALGLGHEEAVSRQWASEETVAAVRRFVDENLR